MEESLDREGIRLTDRAFLLLIIAPLAGLLPVLAMMGPASLGAAGGASPGRGLTYMMMVFLGFVAAPVSGGVMVLRGRPYPLFRRLGQMAFLLPLSQVMGVLGILSVLPHIVAGLLTVVIGLLVFGYLIFAVIAGTIWLAKRPKLLDLIRTL